MAKYDFRFAIFGGSFNPVHNGHIMIAQLLKEELNIENLLIVPTKVSPFKQNEKFSASFEKRFNWIRKSFQGLDNFKISDVEWMMQNDISYTYLTLETLKKKLGEYPLILIGEDSLNSFTKWKNWQEIISKTSLGVYPRDSVKLDREKLIEDGLDFSKVLFPPLPKIDISSSLIRQRIAEGKSIRSFVPYSIEDELIEFYSSVNK